MIAGKYSLGVEDVITIVETSLPHHLHPLVHHCLMPLHINIKSHGPRTGSCRSAGFPIVRSEVGVIISRLLTITGPGWSEDDELLASVTTQVETAGMKQ